MKRMVSAKREAQASLKAAPGGGGPSGAGGGPPSAAGAVGGGGVPALACPAANPHGCCRLPCPSLLTNSLSLGCLPHTDAQRHPPGLPFHSLEFVVEFAVGGEGPTRGVGGGAGVGVGGQVGGLREVAGFGNVCPRRLAPKSNNLKPIVHPRRKHR